MHLYRLRTEDEHNQGKQHHPHGVNLTKCTEALHQRNRIYTERLTSDHADYRLQH